MIQQFQFEVQTPKNGKQGLEQIVCQCSQQRCPQQETWKPPKCPPIHEWAKKTCNWHKMKYYYLALKR